MTEPHEHDAIQTPMRNGKDHGGWCEEKARQAKAQQPEHPALAWLAKTGGKLKLKEPK